MTYYYSLRIGASDEQVEDINGILGVKSNYPPDWGLKLIERENDEIIHFIDYFLSILNGKYEQLERIGITRDDISVWMLYEYDNECNMELPCVSPAGKKKTNNNMKKEIIKALNLENVIKYDI
jgi:hypothetical protein